MSAGKAASQAGHAYLGAYITALNSTLDADHYVKQAQDYSKESPGTKVCLQANLEQLLIAKEKCEFFGIPHFLVVDSGCQNFYDGAPIVTALGIGPAYAQQVKPVVGKFRLHK